MKNKKPKYLRTAAPAVLVPEDHEAWQLQEARVRDGGPERPEYDRDGRHERSWHMVECSSTAEGLLILIADRLNDEEYPVQCWSRIVHNGKSIH